MYVSAHAKNRVTNATDMVPRGVKLLVHQDYGSV